MILWISLAFNIFLLIYGTIFKFYSSIKDNTKYEFVTYDNEYVVLSRYDNKLLVVPYEVDDDGRYIFKTNQYQFKEPYDTIYKYIDIGDSPQIKKDE